MTFNFLVAMILVTSTAAYGAKSKATDKCGPVIANLTHYDPETYEDLHADKSENLLSEMEAATAEFEAFHTKDTYQQIEFLYGEAVALAYNNRYFMEQNHDFLMSNPLLAAQVREISLRADRLAARLKALQDKDPVAGKRRDGQIPPEGQFQLQ